MRWTIDRPEGLSRADMPDRVQEWLDGNGHSGIEVISTAYMPGTGNVRIVVDAEDDPTEAIEAYVPTPTELEVERLARIAAGRDVATKARGNPNAPRTPQEINAFIDAVAELHPELQNMQ